MNKYKEMLEEVKKLVFGEEVSVKEEVTEEQTFAAITLSDGTLIQVEPDVQIGASVMIEDPEMGMVAVPDGSYELEDGRILVVAGGLVESVEQVAEAQAEEEMEANAEPVMTEREVRKIIESVETHFASEIELLKSELAKEKEANKELNEKFFNALVELSETPSEETKVKNKTGFNFKKERGAESLLNKLKK